MNEMRVIDLGNIRESIENNESVYYEYYAKPEADKVIAELKKVCRDKDDWCIHTLKKLRATKRALWLARAERAHAEWGHWATIWFCDTHVELNIDKSSVSQEHHRCTTKRNAAMWRNIWSEVERKCRAKAEETE